MQPWAMNQVGSIAAPWLEWQGSGGSTRRPLDRPLGIGRDPLNDICLPELSVSRRHAVVSLVGGQIVVDASSSQNGIVLGDSRVPRATVVAGQPFVIGETTFRVVAGPTAQPGATGYPGLIAAPVAAPRRDVRPVALIVGGLLIAAIVGAALFLVNGAGNGAGKSSSGSLTFTPSSISCSSTQSMTLTIKLPASLQGSDVVTMEFDGATVGSTTLDQSKLKRQSDGTWLITEPYGYGDCGTSSAVGKHTGTFLDAKGNVLAEGSYTLTPPASDSPSGSITISPSTYTCYELIFGSHTVTITLPGSLQATDVITIEEGKGAYARLFDTKSISAWGFVQSGSSWVLSDAGNLTPISFDTYICILGGTGSYTMYVLDANGNVLAQGNYSLR